MAHNYNKIVKSGYRIHKSIDELSRLAAEFFDMITRSTQRPFGSEPLDPELAAEGLTAEGLSTGTINPPASPCGLAWRAGKIFIIREIESRKRSRFITLPIGHE